MGPTIRVTFQNGTSKVYAVDGPVRPFGSSFASLEVVSLHLWPGSRVKAAYRARGSEKWRANPAEAIGDALIPSLDCRGEW